MRDTVASPAMQADGQCSFEMPMMMMMTIIIIHEFHGDTSLKQNFRAADDDNGKLTRTKLQCQNKENHMIGVVYASLSPTSYCTVHNDCTMPVFCTWLFNLSCQIFNR